MWQLLDSISEAPLGTPRQVTHQECSHSGALVLVLTLSPNGAWPGTLYAGKPPAATGHLPRARMRGAHSLMGSRTQTEGDTDKCTGRSPGENPLQQ